MTKLSVAVSAKDHRQGDPDAPAPWWSTGTTSAPPAGKRIQSSSVCRNTMASVYRLYSATFP
jgi:hypothetical protein